MDWLRNLWYRLQLWLWQKPRGFKEYASQVTQCFCCDSLWTSFVIIFWIFFLINFAKILKYTLFSQNISLIMSIGLVIILAHLSFLRFLSNLTFKVIFYREGIWSWISFVLFILLLVVIGFLIHAFGKSAKAKRKKWFEERERLEQEILHRTIGGLTRGSR